MSRREWSDLALALARLRTRLLDHAERGQQSAHLERVKGVDLSARAICRTLRQRSTRFDGKRFMRIALGSK